MNSMKTKASAMQAAKILIEKMETKGWKARVHENMGWYYRITLGGMAVFEDSGPPGSKRYWTLLTSCIEDAGIGDTFWSNNQNTGKLATYPKMFSNPNKAVQDQLRRADEFLAECTKSIEPFRHLMKYRIYNSELYLRVLSAVYNSGQKTQKARRKTG